MPRFAKGSDEARDWAKKMAVARDKKAGRKSIGADENVVITKMGEPELVLPEYFATKTKKGWKLVNPMTQERNLSTRGGETSVKLSRKPVADGVLIEGKQETIHLSLFPPKDRELIRKSFERVEADTRGVKDKPTILMGEIKERGRPEKLPKNIEINKERKAEKKNARAKPKGRPSKYGDDEEARKQAKKEQDKIANQKRTEKRRQAKLQGAGLSDDESDEELSNIMASVSMDSGKQKPATPLVIQRPIAQKPQVNKGTKRKAETHTHPDGTIMTGKTHTEASKIIKKGSGFKGFKRLDQEHIVLTMDEGDEFKKLIKDETTDDLRMLHQELKEQLRETQLGKQSHTTIRHHNDLRKKISEIEEEVKTRTMSGTGTDDPPIDFEDIKWGSFSKQFQEYNRTAKKPIKDLEKFANMIMKTPEKFKPRTLKRARFYLNVLLKKQKNNISTDNIEMPKKSKMTADAGMGLYAAMPEPSSGRGMHSSGMGMHSSGMGMYAGMAEPSSGRGMYAGDGMYAGEGFFGDLAKSALKSAGSMAVDAGANYAKNRLMGTGMCGGGHCTMCGGAIYNPTGDPKIAEMNEHIRRVMSHQLQMGMSGQGIFGDIGRFFSRHILKPVAGFAIRKGLPALANLAGDVIGQPEIGALATPLVSKGADALARSVGVGMGGTGMKKPSAWIDLVKRVQREKGVSYKEAMSIASQMRR